MKPIGECTGVVTNRAAPRIEVAIAGGRALHGRCEIDNSVLAEVARGGAGADGHKIQHPIIVKIAHGDGLRRRGYWHGNRLKARLSQCRGHR
jgi:hypothetical protein